MYGNALTLNTVMPKSESTNKLLQNSSLYREFLAEREEIMRHKWLESEKAGIDIGFEEALTNWMVNHRAEWRKRRQAERTAV
jgi:hypothetical protein